MWTMVKHGKNALEESIPYQMAVECNTSFLKLLEAFQSKEERIRLFRQGLEQAYEFLECQYMCQEDVRF